MGNWYLCIRCSSFRLSPALGRAHPDTCEDLPMRGGRCGRAASARVFKPSEPARAHSDRADPRCDAASGALNRPSERHRRDLHA